LISLAFSNYVYYKLVPFHNLTTPSYTSNFALGVIVPIPTLPLTIKLLSARNSGEFTITAYGDSSYITSE